MSFGGGRHLSVIVPFSGNLDRPAPRFLDHTGGSL
jgi:hypothetical protein